MNENDLLTVISRRERNWKQAAIGDMELNKEAASISSGYRVLKRLVGSGRKALNAGGNAVGRDIAGTSKMVYGKYRGKYNKLRTKHLEKQRQKIDRKLKNRYQSRGSSKNRNSTRQGNTASNSRQGNTAFNSRQGNTAFNSRQGPRTRKNPLFPQGAPSELNKNLAIARGKATRWAKKNPGKAVGIGAGAGYMVTRGQNRTPNRKPSVNIYK